MLISTRLHGVIDYTGAMLLGMLSTRRGFAAPVRRALGAASLLHLGTATQTDYEAGLQGRISMRQHLALDALVAAGMAASGLLMRRQPGGARALLVAFGLSELAAIGLSSTAPSGGPGQGAGPIDRLLHDPAMPDDQAGYPPLDTPKPVAPDVFVVDSLMPGVMGRILPLRMTVIRLPDGDLLLHSPTRFSFALKQELEALGPIRHLVAPNVAHWLFLQEWQQHCPEATSWATPGLRERGQVRRSFVRLDRDLTAPPPEWGGAIELETVAGALGFREIALFHVPTRTLLLTDLVLNLEVWKLPVLLRPLARLFGSVAPAGMPPPYLRAIVRWGGPAAREAAQRLLAWAPERVTFAHGRWFETEGEASLRRSLRWLIR